MPTRMPSGGGVTRAGPLAPAPTSALEPEVVEAGHYVWLELQGEAYQFTPLLPKTTEKPAGSAAPAPPPGCRARAARERRARAAAGEAAP